MAGHHDGHHHDHQHDHQHGHSFDSPEAAAFLELEGEVLAGFVTQATAVLTGLAEHRGLEVRRVLDLGCGPGVGTTALAEAFPTATVVAVDSSPSMLERAGARAERLRVAERIETRAAEFPDGLDDLGTADVVWASMVMHHVGDEVAALRQVRALLAPGGLLALVERGGPSRYVPDDVDLGRPGLWERLDRAWGDWFGDMRSDLPGVTPSGDYVAMLGEAGFTPVADEELTVVLDPPLDDRARRFAHGRLERMPTQLAPHADPDDLAVLDVLIDEHGDQGILRRDDALLRASRLLYVASA
jgi:SAM-dependent methyltransferase